MPVVSGTVVVAFVAVVGYGFPPDDEAELPNTVRTAQRPFRDDHFAASEILACGTFADDAAPGSLLIGTADRPGRPSGLLCSDPFAEHRLIAERIVRPRSQVLRPRTYDAG